MNERLVSYTVCDPCLHNIFIGLCFSLHSNSKLDVNIKGGMIRDLFNICGFMLPDKNDVTPSGIVVPVDLRCSSTLF